MEEESLMVIIWISAEMEKMIRGFRSHTEKG